MQVIIYRKADGGVAVVTPGNRLDGEDEAAWLARVQAAVVPIDTQSAVVDAATIPARDQRASWKWDNGAIAVVAPVPTARQVKAEAQRRIVALVGTSDLQSCMVKQLNMLMRAVELANKKASGQALSGAEATEAADLQSVADTIKTIRSKSNAIEATSPIPTDYTSNLHWT